MINPPAALGAVIVQPVVVPRLKLLVAVNVQPPVPTTPKIEANVAVQAPADTVAAEFELISSSPDGCAAVPLAVKCPAQCSGASTRCNIVHPEPIVIVEKPLLPVTFNAG